MKSRNKSISDIPYPGATYKKGPQDLDQTEKGGPTQVVLENTPLKTNQKEHAAFLKTEKTSMVK